MIETERLTLTPVAADDYDDLCALWRDEAFTRHITGRSLTGEEVWFRLLRDVGHWSVLGHGNWTLRLKEDGAYVGSVGVLDYRRDLVPAFDAPELGWGLGGAWQGKGLMREALEAALAWADHALKAPRTVCMISPGNAPSLALADRVGYRPYVETAYKDAPVILLERASGVGAA